ICAGLVDHSEEFVVRDQFDTSFRPADDATGGECIREESVGPRVKRDVTVGEGVDVLAAGPSHQAAKSARQAFIRYPSARSKLRRGGARTTGARRPGRSSDDDVGGNGAAVQFNPLGQPTSSVGKS